MPPVPGGLRKNAWIHGLLVGSDAVENARLGEIMCEYIAAYVLGILTYLVVINAYKTGLREKSK
jgi:hypothetical protein